MTKKEALGRRVGSVVVAVGVALFIGLYMIPNALIDFSIGMPVMVAVSAIGAAIFYLTIKKRPVVYWSAQGFFVIAMVLAGLISVKMLSSRPEELLTCPVCGYKTLTVEGAQCGVCGVRTSLAEAGTQGHDSLQSYIKEQQILFFAPERDSFPVNFLGGAPKGSPYIKDSLWKPSITEEDIRLMIQIRVSLEENEARRK